MQKAAKTNKIWLVMLKQRLTFQHVTFKWESKSKATYWHTVLAVVACWFRTVYSSYTVYSRVSRGLLHCTQCTAEEKLLLVVCVYVCVCVPNRSERSKQVPAWHPEEPHPDRSGRRHLHDHWSRHCCVSGVMVSSGNLVGKQVGNINNTFC